MNFCIQKTLKVSALGVAAAAALSTLGLSQSAAAQHEEQKTPSSGARMSCCGPQTPPTAGTPTAAKQQGGAKGVQKATITVTNGAYSPASIAVKAGRPVELTFVLGKNPGCGQVVQFPSLAIRKTLKPGEKSVVSFTPKKAGTFAFTCGMNMYQGQVVVK